MLIRAALAVLLESFIVLHGSPEQRSGIVQAARQTKANQHPSPSWRGFGRGLHA